MQRTDVGPPRKQKTVGNKNIAVVQVIKSRRPLTGREQRKEDNPLIPIKSMRKNLIY